METPLIRLIGDPEDNFYQLGVKDRQAAKILLERMHALISLPWPELNKIIRPFQNVVLNHGIKINPVYKKLMKAYIEGLELSHERYYGGILLPEVMSAMSKWLPVLPKTIFGCSSFFTIDDDYDGPLHGRVLDFPLGGMYEIHERMIYYELKGLPKMIGFNTPGLPGPGLTGMNEYGITLALHQKFTNTFCSEGTPIFELGMQILAECKNREDVLKLLSKSKSITTWCFYLSFADGDILRVDISGNKICSHHDGLSKGKVLYFNNVLEDKEIDQKQFIPYGFDHYNQMRKKIAHKKILDMKHLKSINELSLLKSIATPLDQRKHPAHESKVDCITPSSLGVYSLNASAGRVALISGPAPKYWHGNYQIFSSLWQDPTMISSKEGSECTDYHLGMRHYMKAQNAIDNKCHEEAYHELQMAIDFLKGYPEQYWARFYFLVLWSHREPDTQFLFRQLKEIREILSFLPVPLSDHAKMYIGRIERLTNAPVSIQPSSLNIEQYQKIWQAELKIRPSLAWSMLKTLSSPRLDTLDIIYGHLR